MELTLKSRPALSWNWITNLTPEDPYAPLLVAITLLAIITSFTLEAAGASLALIMTANVISYAAGGYYGLQAGLASLRDREINVDLLMVLAAVGAALVDQWHEGAILLFLFSLSGVLETYAMGRSRRAINSLLALRPDVAKVRRNDEIVSVDIDHLHIGDVVVLEPGELIPVDGRVVRGSSAVNQASITGESMPVVKEIGDECFAGTLNENGAIDIEVTRLASESTLSRIIKLVEEAQDSRADTQRFLDKFEQKYALFVILFVALLVVVPPLLFDVDFADNFYRSMVVLVVASPCALVISTPASILSAIANGARNGVLFKGGAYLEKLADIDALAFDKTGTLTTGEPGLTDIVVLNGKPENELLALVASAESRSEHPLAEAILKAARKRSIPVIEPDAFEAVPGKGVKADVNGETVYVGSRRLMEFFHIAIPDDILQRQHELENDGKTVLIAHNGTEWLGLFAVADTPRTEAIDLVRHLKSAGIKHIAMLTGDNQRVADTLGEQVGFTDVYAELLPEDKVDVVNSLKQYGRVAMVGDGVNDAPALATADIGIAMGAAGTDVALETADLVLMSSDLSRIPFAIGLSRKARRVMIQNIVFSLSVIIILTIAALLPMIDVPLPLGVVGHEGSTLIVVTNGLRLLRYRG